MIVEVTVKELLEVGAYFGHPSRQFDPRIRPYLYGKRQGIYIIDISKTCEKIYQAAEVLQKFARENNPILFVGTKKQARDVIKQAAEKTGQPYVNYRWIGGTLTNFDAIRKRIERLEKIEELEKSGRIKYYTKKEASLIQKEKEDLLKKFEGIRHLDRMPGILFIVDIKKEINAVNEAKKAGIPIVGIVDTNGNPELVEYPIPANDDGFKSIQLIVEKLAEAISEARTEKEIVEEKENGINEDEIQKEGDNNVTDSGNN
ncbi:MAG TPA: 30S ribosomal protein S2 [Candidatus Ratteibacteria bacterium]|jgi:small subunit ribosomal protein S2|nr:30S ribosomal protein S2 [bacterium]HON05710.1 30S ribosomal protein S2 [bacterium]HQL64663.1 30S ribosomal protein S2 [bacterium]HRS06319.1 30S ribosomal protein S2 [Candidatus Ratteibacteria bacterium]HRV04004.1 30S ribosomal protein S2 [Candidatus Ratteibacteria bacterium]